MFFSFNSHPVICPTQVPEVVRVKYSSVFKKNVKKDILSVIVLSLNPKNIALERMSLWNVVYNIFS